MTRPPARKTPPLPSDAEDAPAPDADVKPKRHRAAGFSRDKILMVATRMFAEEGFSATSVRDIATECGITLPSIYHFFGDKQSLYNLCVAESFSAASQRMASAISSGASPKEHVRQAMVAVCDMLLNNDNLRRLLQRAMLRRDYRELDGGMVDYFPAQFAQVTENIGKLGLPGEPAERAFAMYALALGVVQYRPVAERVGLNLRMYSTPVHLAEYVLRTILPELK